MSRKAVPLLLAALVLPLATACGSPQSTVSQTAEPFFGQAQITMANLRFHPNKITVRAGTKLTFINRDLIEHDVVQVAVKRVGKDKPGFQSPVIKAGEDWTVTMDRPGVYPVVCTQAGHHLAGMALTVEVVQ